MRVYWMLILPAVLMVCPAAEGQLRIARLEPAAQTLSGQVDRNLVLTVNQTRLAAVGGVGAIQVRMLRGSKAQLHDSPLTPDSCLVLLSVVLYPLHLGGGTLDLRFKFSDEWVRIKEGRVYEETYTIVFEFRNPVGTTLKLDPDDLDTYLASSVEIVLRPPENMTPARIHYLAPYSQPQPRRLVRAGQCWRASAQFRQQGLFAAAGDCDSRSPEPVFTGSSGGSPSTPVLAESFLCDLPPSNASRLSAALAGNPPAQECLVMN